MCSQFLLNHPIFGKTELKLAFASIFRKNDEKMARKKTYRLKLEFFKTDRKMKNIIRHIFISIIVHPILVHFR